MEGKLPVLEVVKLLAQEVAIAQGWAEGCLGVGLGEEDWVVGD